MIPPGREGHWAAERSSRSAPRTKAEQPGQSIEAEVHIDDHLHGYGMAFIGGRPESILLDGRDRLFVKPHAEVTNHTDILGEALGIDYELNCHNPPKAFVAASGVNPRLNGVYDLRSADAAPDAHDTTAVAAIAAWTLTGAEG